MYNDLWAIFMYRYTCYSLIDQLKSIKSASGNLNKYIASKTTIIPGVCSPEVIIMCVLKHGWHYCSLFIVQLLPNGIEDLTETSVELAVCLGK